MSDTALLQPHSSTASLDPFTLRKFHNSMNLLGDSELQSLQYNESGFKDHTSNISSVATGKALVYGNIYHSFLETMHSFLSVFDAESSSQKSQLFFDEIEWGTYKFRLTSPLEVDLNFADDLWEAENKELDILIVADDIDELKSSFQEEFFVMWQVYSQEPDEKLTTKAKQIKANLLNLITGVVVDCD